MPVQYFAWLTRAPALCIQRCAASNNRASSQTS